jgi:hypothetical protein
MATEKTSKRATAIRIMTENKTLAMADVVELIAKAIDVTTANAKSYYKYIVANKLGPGKVEAGRSKAKAEPKAEKTVKTKAVAKVKSVIAEDNKRIKEAKTVEAKPKGNRFTGKVKAESKTKTDDDLAKIKAANLKRMKEITERNKVIRAQYNGNIARGADAPFEPLDFTPEGARAEVDQMYKDLDSFEMPKFLSKDQVKALV